MKDLGRHIVLLFLALSISVGVLTNVRVEAEEKPESMLPAADLYNPDEIKEGFERQKITPFDDPKFYFEILIPKDWDSRPHNVSKLDFQEAESGKAMVGMAMFRPNSGSGKDVIINVNCIRIPTSTQLTDWMDTILKNMDGKILVRQRGEYNGRMVEDALLEKVVEGPVLTRLTASRHGDYIFVVTGSSGEEEYPKYKRILGLAAVSFNPLSEASKGGFKISDFKFLESQNGPERTEGAYRPKDKVYMTFEFSGFGLDKQGRPDLLVEMTVSDPDGIALFKPIKDEIRQDVKGKNPLGYLNADLPAYAAPGNYGIRIKAHDAVGDADFEFVQPFKVEGPPVVASALLEFRDCEFSSAKDGPPEDPLVVKAGDKIYSSSKVAGMQFREDKMNVRISMQVVGPLGDIIFEKPDLVTLNDSCVYRPPTLFVEINTWIGLPTDSRPGKYRWKYKITDLTTNATADYEKGFEVR